VAPPDKYISNLYQLQQRLYHIFAQEMGGNNNFHNEKNEFINFVKKQLKKMLTVLKG
jgi:hypothetical protein